MRDRYEAAPTFDAFVASAQQNKALWETMYRLARVPQSFVDRVRVLPGQRHLLVLNEDWCGDAVNTVPSIAKLVSLAPDRVDLRVVGRDANPDLMDAHLTGTSRAIPVVILLDEDYVERGWWGPRPTELQTWVLGPGRALDKAERYREIRRWYARDRALSTLEEVVAMMEEAIRYPPPAGGGYPAIRSREGGGCPRSGRAGRSSGRSELPGAGGAPHQMQSNARPPARTAGPGFPIFG